MIKLLFVTKKRISYKVELTGRQLTGSGDMCKIHGNVGAWLKLHNRKRGLCTSFNVGLLTHGFGD